MMSRIAVGMMIAIAALIMNGGLIRPVPAEELGKPSSPALSTTITPAGGHRSERVLSLLIALEALRAAPEVLEKR